VWNQHAYHITHILEDGSVPGPEPVHYQNDVTNSFRLNVQPDGLFNAPDLVVESVEIRNAACGDTVTVEIAVTVTNAGSLGVGAGTEVVVTADNAGEGQPVGTVTTTRALLPSQSETILITFTLPAGWENADFTVSATVDLDLTITNNGQMGVPNGLPIVVEALRGTTATPIDTVTTQGGLGPGQSQSFQIDWTAADTLLGQQFEVRATIDPNGVVTACSSENTFTYTPAFRSNGKGPPR
jgi:hypothetical protein